MLPLCCKQYIKVEMISNLDYLGASYLSHFMHEIQPHGEENSPESARGRMMVPVSGQCRGIMWLPRGTLE